MSKISQRQNRLIKKMNNKKCVGGAGGEKEREKREIPQVTVAQV